MPYRPTERTEARRAATRERIVSAALDQLAEGGYASAGVQAVARRAGVATGSVYRYFPSKSELVAALVESVSEREIGAMRRAADAAPGPLSALAAAITTYAARALEARTLAFALIAEPVDAAADDARLAFRAALSAELGKRLTAAMKGGHLPEQDIAVAAPALTGALIEGLIGPLATDTREDIGKHRDAVQTITLFALRAVGVADARARGLVVQTQMPEKERAE
jgi:AcrR family transcriptional regulator